MGQSKFPVGIVVLLCVMGASSCAALMGLRACWRDFMGDVEAGKKQEDEQAAADMREARRKDREELEAKQAASAQAALKEQLVHDQLVKKYAAMKPWQRTAEVSKVCSPIMPCANPQPQTVDEILHSGGDDCCPYKPLDALVESVTRTPEATSLQATVDAAKKVHANAAAQASKSARCCDGTLSDSCMCNAVHQGCCSHHGGVCGCE